MGRRSRWKRALLVTVVALAGSLLAAEAVFRATLFGDGFFHEQLGPHVRRPRNYANPIVDENYWKLQVSFLDPDRLRDIPRPDPVLGWVGDRVTPGSYAVEPFGEPAGRRKVLLYGDSFAACARGAPRAECFEGLLARSELGSALTLLNFGAHGYGLDQIYLLLRATLDDHAGDDPRVIVGILVDDDLDRVVLDFRGWPKPRLKLVEGELVSGPPLPPSTLEYLDQHPITIRSYLWRYLLHGSGLLPKDWVRSLSGYKAANEEKQALSRRLLEEIGAELRARELEAFFVLFHGPKSVRSPGPHTWRERLLIDFFEEQGWPWVSSKTELRADAKRTGRGVDSYFLLEGTEARHYNALGNEVAFRALLRGLQGRFEAARDR